MKVTIKSKLRCPYCKGRQEFQAKDYFQSGARDGAVEEVQCGHCDWFFNVILQDGKTKVEAFSNMTTVPWHPGM